MFKDTKIYKDFINKRVKVYKNGFSYMGVNFSIDKVNSKRWFVTNETTGEQLDASQTKASAIYWACKNLD